MKKLQLKDAEELDDYERAIFREYRAAELADRGHVELDIVRATGRPAVPQITTRYVEGDRVTFELPVDDRTEAMHGRPVNIGGRVVVLKLDKAT